MKTNGRSHKLIAFSLDGVTGAGMRMIQLRASSIIGNLELDARETMAINAFTQLKVYNTYYMTI